MDTDELSQESEKGVYTLKEQAFTREIIDMCDRESSKSLEEDKDPITEQRTEER